MGSDGCKKVKKVKSNDNQSVHSIFLTGGSEKANCNV